jgi:hypothetical protein
MALTITARQAITQKWLMPPVRHLGRTPPFLPEPAGRLAEPGSAGQVSEGEQA